MFGNSKKLAGAALAATLMFGTTVLSQPALARSGGGEGPSRADDAESVIQAQITSVYQTFLNSYRLGPGDVFAVHIDKHPEDSLERAVVSPGGQIYYPLLGTVAVAGKTIPQLQLYFTTSVSEFIRQPRVAVNLLEANSAKIGVLGDVRSPGVVVMNRPMRVLDAIAMVGGVAETGNSSKVSLLRQHEDGRIQLFSVNVKSVLHGRAGPEDNPYLQRGDTIIVHGNLFKKVSKISSLMGIGSFVAFLANGRQ